jgi:TolB-like protein
MALNPCSPCTRPARLAGWLILPMLLLVGCASPAGRDMRVLVMNFENTVPDSKSEKYSKSLAEYMTSCLANCQRVSVLERQDLDYLLDYAENRPTCWQKLGKKTGRDYVVVGFISRLDSNYIVNSRLLSVRTGQIVKGSSVTRYCKREEDLYPVVQSMCRFLAYQLKTLAELYDAQAGVGPAVPAAAAAPAASNPVPSTNP